MSKFLYREKKQKVHITFQFNAEILLFFKIENDSEESLFCIACNSLITFRGIKQSLPTTKKGDQKFVDDMSNKHIFGQQDAS